MNHVEEITYVDPADAFAGVAEEPFSLLFDSALRSERLGRYSYIAALPRRTLTAKGRVVAMDGRAFEGDPFTVLRDELARTPRPTLSGLPPFQGGAAGMFGYDLCHHLEALPSPATDDMDFDHMAVGFYDTVAAFDVVDQRAWIIAHGDRAAFNAGELRERLHDRPPILVPVPVLEWTSNFSRSEYQAAVGRVIDYIHAGDIFQANLSQRFRAALPAGADPYAMYCRLRTVNAAPFAAYFNTGDSQILSSSPERFLKLTGDVVEARPIKGTRPRGATPTEDAALAENLMTSEKDRAENVMIVDLLRNDISKVCRDHSVVVPELCSLESYARVHHLVSAVTGQLRPETGAVDVLRACFPGGSITGAPKVRAMEIIAELEPNHRGPYCGALGFIGYDGAMDSNIAIRTMALKDGAAVFQAGGGIVADSDSADEYLETLAKAEALFAAFAPRANAAVEAK
jgi:para-aminobenzoate synthetase component 1